MTLFQWRVICFRRGFGPLIDSCKELHFDILSLESDVILSKKWMTSFQWRVICFSRWFGPLIDSCKELHFDILSLESVSNVMQILQIIQREKCQSLLMSLLNDSSLVPKQEYLQICDPGLTGFLYYWALTAQYKILSTILGHTFGDIPLNRLPFWA